MPIYFYQGKILIRSGQIAMDAKCCCGRQCCCALDPNTTYYATFSSPCAAIDGRVIPIKIAINTGTPICQLLTQTEDETIDPCTTAVVPIKISMRCNLDLAVRSGQGECDRYEMEVYYLASPCKDTRGWVRVSLGCSCSPLSLSFLMAAPEWSGLGAIPDCDCCNGVSKVVTVTVTA